MPDNQKPPMWDSLWINANLATMAGGYGVIENAALAVQGGRIAWLGGMAELKDKPSVLAAQVHDANHKWLTPGLIDCHTHLVYGGNRAHEFEQRMQGKTYADIAKAGGGILSTVKATRAASEEELFASAEKRLQSFLREGVTVIEIKSGYGLDAASEIKMLRVARALGKKYPVTVCTTFLGAHTTSPEYAGDKDAYIDAVCNEMLPAVAAAGLADAVDGFCEHMAFSPAQMQKIFIKAQSLGLKVKLHAEQLSDQNGAALAAQYHALSADHLEHANEAGIAAMAKAGAVAVLLPGAFYMLRETKKPPVELLRKHSVPIALASDCNPGTSPVTSLLLMLNMGCVLFGLTPEDALAGVTRNAARALGLSDAGTLVQGNVADMALWDISHPLELSYAIGANPCCGVMKNGIYKEFKE